MKEWKESNQEYAVKMSEQVIRFPQIIFWVQFLNVLLQLMDSGLYVDSKDAGTNLGDGERVLDEMVCCGSAQIV